MLHILPVYKQWPYIECRHSSECSSAPTILQPRVRVPSTPSFTVKFTFDLSWVKDKCTQKRGRVCPFKNMTLLSCTFLILTQEFGYFHWRGFDPATSRSTSAKTKFPRHKSFFEIFFSSEKFSFSILLFLQQRRLWFCPVILSSGAKLFSRMTSFLGIITLLAMQERLYRKANSVVSVKLVTTPLPH